MARNELAKKMARLALDESVTETAIPDVKLFRATTPERAQPVA